MTSESEVAPILLGNRQAGHRLAPDMTSPRRRRHRSQPEKLDRGVVTIKGWEATSIPNDELV